MPLTKAQEDGLWDGRRPDQEQLALGVDEDAPPYVAPPATADEVAAEREAGATVAAMRHAHGDPSA